jgi:hypothetical protein
MDRTFALASGDHFSALPGALGDLELAGSRLLRSKLQSVPPIGRRLGQPPGACGRVPVRVKGREAGADSVSS